MGGAPVRRRSLAALACAAWGCLTSPPPSRLADDPDGGTSDDGGVLRCSPGDPIAGEPFNASPVDPDSACAVENVLERDGEVAGLDRFFGDVDSACSIWQEPELGACGCVGLDLGGIYPVSSFVVRAAPSADACGQSCSACGTGHTFTTWIGSTEGEYALARDITMAGDVLADYTVQVAADLRYVVVCRDVWGEERDDVAVDSLEVVCQ